jgi:hypothetical protein
LTSLESFAVLGFSDFKNLFQATQPVKKLLICWESPNMLGEIIGKKQQLNPHFFDPVTF